MVNLFAQCFQRKNITQSDPQYPLLTLQQAGNKRLRPGLQQVETQYKNQVHEQCANYLCDCKLQKEASEIEELGQQRKEVTAYN